MSVHHKLCHIRFLCQFEFIEKLVNNIENKWEKFEFTISPNRKAPVCHIL